MSETPHSRTVICVANEGNEVSLQLWKIYKTLPDSDAEGDGMLRVIDEEGEDYLFPEENFVPIQLPAETRESFERAVRRQRRGTSGPNASHSLKVIGRSESKRKRVRGA